MKKRDKDSLKPEEKIIEKLALTLIALILAAFFFKVVFL